MTAEEAVASLRACQEELLGFVRRCLEITNAYAVEENPSQLTLAYAASRVAISNALTDSLSLLEKERLFSAGAILRRALEITYVNVLLVRKRDQGANLLVLWMRRSRASSLQELIASEAPDGTDKSPFITEAAELKKKLANGDRSRVTEEQLAKWAGLENDHDLIYSRLNPFCHFNLSDVLHEYDDYRGDQYDPVTLGALRLPIKIELLLIALRIGLYVLIGMRDFGVAQIAGDVETIATILRVNEEKWQDANIVLGRYLNEIAARREDASE